MPEMDCRGRACPEPVMMTKAALEHLQEGALVVLIDDPASCENVERFARSQGFAVQVEKTGQQFRLSIEKRAAATPRKVERSSPVGGKIVVYINSELLGVGEEVLGAVLMRAFLRTLQEIEPKPARLILINSGVRLASEGSDALEALRGLSERGVEIVACGTCLDFYGLKEKLKAGRVSNMYEIAQSLLEAERVIRP
jgi:selenium metabolism protein YedF